MTNLDVLNAARTVRKLERSNCPRLTSTVKLGTNPATRLYPIPPYSATACRGAWSGPRFSADLEVDEVFVQKIQCWAIEHGEDHSDGDSPEPRAEARGNRYRKLSSLNASVAGDSAVDRRQDVLGDSQGRDFLIVENYGYHGSEAGIPQDEAAVTRAAKAGRMTGACPISAISSPDAGRMLGKMELILNASDRISAFWRSP